jgi:hypothetical protein
MGKKKHSSKPKSGVKPNYQSNRRFTDFSIKVGYVKHSAALTQSQTT